MHANSIRLKTTAQLVAILGLAIFASSASLAQSVLTDDAHTSQSREI
jgi:hypothetical protein